MTTHTVDQIKKWSDDWGQRFPKRVTRKQKEPFLQELEMRLHERGFTTERLSGRNIVPCHNLATICPHPKVIFMAHYDTPTIIPFWFSAFFRLIGHTRQILAMFVLIGLMALPTLISSSPIFISVFHLFILLSFLSLLIPNPHNREDNTSGIVGLMALAEWLQDKPVLQKEVQLIFLDNEEWGLLGAGALKKHWDKGDHPYQKAIIINLDCVSRGEQPLLIYHKHDALARKVCPYLQTYLPKIKQIDMRFIALSDNYVFRQQGAVNISYADPTIIPGGYYIAKIHTPSDKDFYPHKLQALVHGLTDFLEEFITES